MSDEEIHHVFIARHVSTALGPDNNVLLSAVPDRFAGVMDIQAVLRKEGCAGNSCSETSPAIYAILHERGLDCGTSFHGATDADEDCAHDYDIYVDLGQENPEDLQNCIAEMVQDTRESSPSDQVAGRLRANIRKCPVFEFGWENPLSRYAAKHAPQT